MARYEHADLIKAKADNDELCVFSCVEGVWLEHCANQLGLMEANPDRCFFICLPELGSICSNWLNGVSISYAIDEPDGTVWYKKDAINTLDINDDVELFTCENTKLRINHIEMTKQGGWSLTELSAITAKFIRSTLLRFKLKD